MQQPDEAPSAAISQGGSADRAPMLVAKRFLPLFLVQSLGAFNDNVFKNAFIALLTFSLIDKLDLQMSLTTLASIAAGVFILPFALFASFAGQIADGVDKAKMMRVVKFAEIVLMAGAAVAYHVQSVFLLYVLLFLMGAQSAFFGPIKYGVLPRYLPDDELVHGNGLIQAGSFLAILFGTIAGFQLMKTDGGVLVVSIAVVLVAIAGFIASLYAPPAPPASDQKAHLLPNHGLRLTPNTPAASRLGLIALVACAALVGAIYYFIGPDSIVYADRPLLAVGAVALVLSIYVLSPSIADSVDASQERPIVWRTILAISWFWFAAVSFMTLLPALVKETLRGDQDVVTLLLASFSIGVAIGASLVSKLQQGRIQVGVAPWGAIGIALFSIDLYAALGGGYAPTGLAEGELRGVGAFFGDMVGWRVMADFVGLAICAGLYVTPLNAIYQHNAPPEALGRVVATSNMLDATFMTCSAIVLIILSTLSPPLLMAVIGGTGLLAGLVTARWSPETRIGRAVLTLLPRKGGE